MYGLKQAPKQWHKCVHIKWLANDFVIVTLYFDGMLNVGTCITILASNYDMIYRWANVIVVGVKIIKCETDVMLMLEHYVERLHKKFGHHNCNPMGTPYDVNTQLIKNEGDSIDQCRYAQIIGSWCIWWILLDLISLTQYVDWVTIYKIPMKVIGLF